MDLVHAYPVTAVLRLCTFSTRLRKILLLCIRIDTTYHNILYIIRVWMHILEKCEKRFRDSILYLERRNENFQWVELHIVMLSDWGNVFIYIRVQILHVNKNIFFSNSEIVYTLFFFVSIYLFEHMILRMERWFRWMVNNK